MHPGIIGQAVGLFAVTNVDDLLLLSVLFARGAGRRSSTRRIVLGQYLGFAAILAAALSGTFLSEAVIPYLGLLPLALGLKAARQAWRNHRDGEDDADGAGQGAGPSLLEVVVLTFAKGGDNIGVHVPVFATAGLGGVSAYAIVFLALLAVWCCAGRFLATRPAVAQVFGRWGDTLLPVVLIAIGLFLLIEGGLRALSRRRLREPGEGTDDKARWGCYVHPTPSSVSAARCSWVILSRRDLVLETHTPSFTGTGSASPSTAISTTAPRGTGRSAPSRSTH